MLRGLAAPVTDAAKRKTKVPIRWEFDEQSGKISFFGNGPIPDYTEHNPPSWDALKKDIRVIEMDEGITRVGGQNFSGCTNLAEVNLPDTVRSIGYRAFSDCKILDSIKTSRTWSHAYEAAYHAQRNPADDGSIRVGMRAFEGSSWYGKLFGTYCIIDGVLIEYYGTEETIKLPSGIREIGFMAFEGKSVRHITFPKSLKTIHSCAFRSTALEELILPRSVEVIHEFAFSNIPNLQYVLIRNRNLTVDKTSFLDTPVFRGSFKRNGKWASLYDLNPGEEIGTGHMRKLTGGISKEFPMGVSAFRPKMRLLQMIRSGSMVLRIRINRECKKVDYVQAFAKHPSCGYFSYIQYPCIRDGYREPYSEDTTYIDRNDILYCNQEGLWPAKNDDYYEWYIVPYERELESWAAFELWTEWLEKNRDYSVETFEYQYENLIRKMFPY